MTPVMATGIDRQTAGAYCPPALSGTCDRLTLVRSPFGVLVVVIGLNRA